MYQSIFKINQFFHVRNEMKREIRPVIVKNVRIERRGKRERIYLQIRKQTKKNFQNFFPHFPSQINFSRNFFNIKFFWRENKRSQLKFSRFTITRQTKSIAKSWCFGQVCRNEPFQVSPIILFSCPSLQFTKYSFHKIAVLRSPFPSAWVRSNFFFRLKV